MRYLALAAALTMGGTALAQDAPPPADAPAAAPSSSAPERDARGIPVVSNPAEAPAGANQAPPPGAAVPAPNQQAVFATKPAAGEYPVCSRTVTDGCVQSYERGRQPG